MKTMEKTHAKCLLLNADYTPIYIMDWKKALVWSLRYVDNSKYAIEIIDFYKNDFIIGANNKKYQIPAVVKTNKYFIFFITFDFRYYKDINKINKHKKKED